MTCRRWVMSHTTRVFCVSGVCQRLADQRTEPVAVSRLQPRPSPSRSVSLANRLAGQRLDLRHRNRDAQTYRRRTDGRQRQSRGWLSGL